MFRERIDFRADYRVPSTACLRASAIPESNLRSRGTEYQHAIGELGDVLAVRRVHTRHVERGNRSHDRKLAGEIEVAGAFVEKQQRGRVGRMQHPIQRARQQQTLLLTRR